jgi:hypothetical protein
VVTVNDEAGSLTIATAAGENSHLIKINSYQPPQTFLAFSPDGWYVTGESAPGFPSLLKRYLPNGLSEIMAGDIPQVSGVAVGKDGSVYASGTASGEIIKINPDGSRTMIAGGLNYPQALAITGDGTLLAVTGGMGEGDVFSMPQFGDAVVSISLDGGITNLAQVNAAADIALGSDGYIYMPGEKAVYRVSRSGEKETFAEGFGWARGVAFDAAGNLLVSDDLGNAIVMISGFPQGYIKGSVLDNTDDSAIEDAKIQITQSSPPYAGRFISTDKNGNYSLGLAPAGYTLTTWKDGYQKTTIENVEINEGEEIIQVIHLTR